MARLQVGLMSKHHADLLKTKNTVYENTQNEMISEFIQNDDGDYCNYVDGTTGC
jgi:hypothetical protein